MKDIKIIKPITINHILIPETIMILKPLANKSKLVPKSGWLAINKNGTKISKIGNILLIKELFLIYATSL